MRAWLVLGLSACGGPPSGRPPVDTDGPAVVDTDPPPPQPTTLELACAPTDNRLRFTCAVTVEPAQPVEVRWVRADGVGPERVRASEVAATDHAVPVYFLGPEREYTVEASAGSSPPVAIRLVTEALPPSTASRLAITGTSTMGLVGTETPCDARAIAVIYDTTTGDLVWYQDLDPSGNLGFLDMVRFTDRHTVVGETGSIVEVDLLGNDLARFPADYPGCCTGLSHDVFAADGLYWSQYQDIDGELTLDNVVVIDAAGVEQYQWRAADHLVIPAAAEGDFLHTNSIYVAPDGDFTLSWFTRDTVAKIEGDRSDPAWGRPIWLMTGHGEAGALGNDFTLDWSAIGGPDRFGGQHNVHLRHDGRLMMLDNDNGRGLVLTLDEAARTATVDAEYPTRETTCRAQGTAMDTRAGNAVVACSTAWVREYDLATADLVWEAEIDCENGGGGGLSPNAAARWYPLDGWE